MELADLFAYAVVLAVLLFIAKKLFIKSSENYEPNGTQRRITV